jgi:hypothetical protein
MALPKFDPRDLGIGGALRMPAVICCAALVLVMPAAAQITNETPPPGYPPSGCDYDQRGNYYCWGNKATGPAVPIYWAAIAVSPTTLVSGTSNGQNSEAEAKQLALGNCATRASDCKLVNWGSNLCFALAVSRHELVFDQDFAPSRERAASKALAGCRKAGGKSCFVQATPCAGDDARWPAPLPLPPAPAGQAVALDPQTVGIWKLSIFTKMQINPGIWVLEIASNGTYEFHSEAGDGAPSQAGTFSASGGHWSMHATNGDTDGGTYKFASPGVWVATGKLGTGTWRK